MNCQICNKESGEYSLCPECFELMQSGEVKQCINCKRWYKVGKICECLKQNESSRNEPVSDELPTTKENIEIDKKESVLHFFIQTIIKTFLIVFIILIIPVGILFVDAHVKNTGPHGEETSWFTALTKEKPSIYASPSYDPNGDFSEFLGYEFGVNCKDDYKEVTIVIYYKDENYNLIKKDYITFENCKEGQRKEQLYTFTTHDILTIKHVDYELYKYK